MRSRPRRASYRRWKCDTCHVNYETPIPSLAVTCPSPIRKHGGKVVMMKPVEEEDERTPATRQ